jgi:hypothetical protein
LYPELERTKGSFYLNPDLFAPPRDELLCKFAKEVFEGVQYFVEELYDLLRQAIEAHGSLQLS